MTIELVLRTAKRVALYVDQENGAPDFWDAVETRTPPDDDAALLRTLDMSTPLIVSPDVARRILAWAQTLPEWEADDAPEFAPHPILVQDADQ
jgi:hypothetical protein